MNVADLALGKTSAGALFITCLLVALIAGAKHALDIGLPEKLLGRGHDTGASPAGEKDPSNKQPKKEDR